MRRKSLWIIFITLVTLLAPQYTSPAQSNSWSVPTLKSFDFSPKEIELVSGNTNLKVTVIVTHPIGISSEKITLNLNKGTNFTISYDLIRKDIPVNFKLTEVVFEGNLKLPNSLPNGVWKLSTGPVEAFPPAGSSLKPISNEFTPSKFRDFVDAENALLVRLNGSLDFDFTTFVGPTFQADSAISDDKPRTLKYKNPIWRVGEIFDPKDYFELRTSLVQLRVQSKTPLVCEMDGNRLKLIKEGDCYYRVYTEKTNNFLAKEINLGATILKSRTKPTLEIPQIETQNSINLPRDILGKVVYFNGLPLTPQNVTPSICIANNMKITIYSGGICKLEYFVEETSTNLASEKYIQSFEIRRDEQSIDFSPPKEVSLNLKSIKLISKASSGGTINYEASPTSVCSIISETLQLLSPGACTLTATQAGNATIAPISKTMIILIKDERPREKVKISCVKGSKKLSVTKVNPKCPKGYSRVR